MRQKRATNRCGRVRRGSSRRARPARRSRARAWAAARMTAQTARVQRSCIAFCGVLLYSSCRRRTDQISSRTSAAQRGGRMNAPTGGQAAGPRLADFILLNEESAALVRTRVPLESHLAPNWRRVARENGRVGRANRTSAETQARVWPTPLRLNARRCRRRIGPPS